MEIGKHITQLWICIYFFNCDSFPIQPDQLLFHQLNLDKRLYLNRIRQQEMKKGKASVILSCFLLWPVYCVQQWLYPFYGSWFYHVPVAFLFFVFASCFIHDFITKSCLIWLFTLLIKFLHWILLLWTSHSYFFCFPLQTLTVVLCAYI